MGTGGWVEGEGLGSVRVKHELSVLLILQTRTHTHGGHSGIKVGSLKFPKRHRTSVGWGVLDTTHRMEDAVFRKPGPECPGKCLDLDLLELYLNLELILDLDCR